MLNERDRTDLWTAVAIGAVVGVGAALLLRAEDEPRAAKLLRSLQPLRKKAGKSVRRARREISRRAEAVGSTGEDLVHDGAKALRDLRKDAAKIVAEAKRDIEDAARGGLKQASRTARRTRQRFS